MDEDFQEKLVETFSVVGAGNLGVPFSRALQRAGYRLRWVFQKAKDRALEPYFQSDADQMIRDSDFVVIAVQESKIGAVANALAGSTHLSRKVFFHTANSLNSDELKPLQHKGAAIASFSPLQTFPHWSAGDEKLFSGIAFLLEGDDKAKSVARVIARKLGSSVVEVEKSEKIFIHIAAIAASNFLVSLFVFMERLLAKTDSRKKLDILLPLIRQTMKNVETSGTLPSLSGPLRRSEGKIIGRHLDVLSGLDRDLYRVMTDYLRKFCQNGMISVDQDS